MIQTLLNRRSTKVTELLNPGPDPDEIQTLLTAAARVPDHGRLVPFRFVVFQGETRQDFGRVIVESFQKSNPNAPQEKVALEQNRLSHAPLVIAVISRMRKGKHPRWEQVLTSGAVCQNMLLAAESMGYGAQWLTQWFAYDDAVRNALGCDEREQVAGFIHIGTKPGTPPEDRERPDLARITTHYGDDMQYGDAHYDRDKFDLPPAL